ncbi:MFS family permease [Agromyces terreus]|uniref:MFS family permease n=1 Tax=Agromyces terreus TaxID=424795 RepID=A0A9X2KDZ5_9MICO|nr:MFS transporter [Agromyces terreus]MCP2370092.1 MFS family permease [Agromyces terreus]
MPRPAGARTPRPAREPRRGLALGILIVNQLLAGVGVASGMALAAILVADLTGVVAMGGLAQSSSVLGAAIVAIPLAKLAVRSGRHVALAVGYALAVVGALLVIAAATSGWAPLVFLGLAAFGAGSAAGLQARFAATEVASPGFEARSMSLVLWATTIGSVAGPLLSESGDRVGTALGLPHLVGPFVFSAFAFAVSTILVATLLRIPRAGVLATDAGGAGAAAADGPRGGGDAGAGATADDAPVEAVDVVDATGAAPAASVGSLMALRLAVKQPRALFAILAIVCSHTVMVGVMVMTPVHMTEHGLSLSLVGLVISIHILGMYGASPVMGWLVDRIGSVRVILMGAAILVLAAVIGILAPGDDMLLVSLALGLLGLGWSAGMIGGSTLVTTSVDARLRVPLQGATDASMNLAAAVSAALSGVVLGAFGFAGVNAVALLVLVPLAVAGLRLMVGPERRRRVA